MPKYFVSLAATDCVLGSVALATIWPKNLHTDAPFTGVGLFWIRKDVVGRGIGLKLTQIGRSFSATHRAGYASI